MLRRLIALRPIRLALITATGLVVTFLIAAALIAIDGLTDSAAPSDVVVVLGNEVGADGKPAARLAARLDAAIDVHDSGLAEYVIVSGGTGESGFSEADVMATYLTDAGINGDDIVIDRTGITTRATATNAALIMDERGWQSAIVATREVPAYLRYWVAG